MKIGILTFHHTANYGAILQAYGLWKAIKNLGHDVEIIDYRPEKVDKHFWQGKRFIRLKSIIKGKGAIIDPSALVKFMKYLKFRYFLNFKMKLSKKKFSHQTDLNNFAFKYDLVVCGSDQIWCLNSKFRGFNSSYFLDFIDSKFSGRKVSYAASFGSTEDLGDKQDLISKLLGDFNVISVRDSNSLKIVEQECKQQAVKVLDPTFLIDYDKITLPPKKKSNYLLVYNHGELVEAEKNIILQVAKELNLSIISLEKENDIADENLINIGPREWLGYFNQASYVITNTYHGTIFSLKFEKQFSVFSYQGKQFKIPDLLKMLKLENRILDTSSFNSVNIKNLNSIDYSLVNKRIAEEVEKSQAYLSNSIISKN